MIEDAARLDINGYDHRRFLNAFYTGRFPGSFARGLTFQENPNTGDCRISGTAGSLVGLEKALREETDAEVELAIRRILLIHGIIVTAGGIPLIYLGDEVGTLNDYDYGYRNDSAKAGDSRWVHRPYADWQKIEQRCDGSTVAGRIYQGLCRLLDLRKSHSAFAGHELQAMDTGNDHVLGYVRSGDSERVIVPANQLRLYGLSYNLTELLIGKSLPWSDVQLEPYRLLCLR